jgi:hypothetical protein
MSSEVSLLLFFIPEGQSGKLRDAVNDIHTESDSQDTWHHEREGKRSASSTRVPKLSKWEFHLICPQAVLLSKTTKHRFRGIKRRINGFSRRTTVVKNGILCLLKDSLPWKTQRWCQNIWCIRCRLYRFLRIRPWFLDTFLYFERDLRLGSTQ